MEHDDPKLIVAFDPVKLLAPAVVGLLLADVLLGFVLSMQLKAVLAHPWQSIGYTALILILYAILMVLNVCAICAVAIGALSAAFCLMRFVFRACVLLLMQPVRLAMNGYRVIAATAHMPRKRIP
ncbi:hypothetical protein [Rhizobium hainanense]|uniref:Uncharacterized protein n=1 Tax=Rhizobium hainanense TaxID=52131 RepID=A0A1C3WL77_9HYPH|nr:hypothetical protein [Rhizobium hainanense]SCB40484.1 hypothetical protein GA0061100_12516 [Rhizobium hainanense]